MLIPPRVSISLMSGPRDGDHYHFSLSQSEKGHLRISMGRRDNCDIPLGYDSQVSRLHAQILLEDGAFWLEDMESRNGTFINDRQLELGEKVMIEPGTLFRLGRTWLRLDPLPPDETQSARPVVDDDSFDPF